MPENLQTSSNVPVATRFRDRGRCSDFFFEALIPVARTVAANSVAQVVLKITSDPSQPQVSSTLGFGSRIPLADMPDASGRMPSRPRSLREFKTLHLSVNATRGSQLILPQAVTISTHVADMDRILRNPSPTE